MRTITVICAALLVGGCAIKENIERQEAINAQQRANEDDAKCLSYGARRGDPAYVQCRAQLDAARSQSNAIAAAAPSVFLPPPQSVEIYRPPPGLPSP